MNEEEGEMLGEEEDRAPLAQRQRPGAVAGAPAGGVGRKEPLDETENDIDFDLENALDGDVDVGGDDQKMKGEDDRPESKTTVNKDGSKLMGESLGSKRSIGDSETDEEEDERDELEEDINVTDSQIMIQLKEAEEEAACLREEIACLRKEICDYQCRPVLCEEDRDHLREIQVLLMEKVAQLDELTKRIAKLMEFAGKDGKEEETTILDEEEDEKFPDDLLPRVVICSSWDDMMPKVVVCMDMKKPGAVKRQEWERDENGLTPEQREALEQERRCMAEERNRLQYQIACMEGEMRVMVRENDLLSRKVAQLKSEIENQPPFEFEMSVSATQPPGVGHPKPGNADIGYGVMGPNTNNVYTMGAALAPGAEVQGKLAVGGPGLRHPSAGPGAPLIPALPYNYQRGPNNGRQAGQLPCGGATGIPGKSVPCSKMQTQEPAPLISPNDTMSALPPFGKKCRKDFNASRHAYDGNYGCGGGCCGGGGGGCGGCGGGCGGGQAALMMPCPPDQNFTLPPSLLKQPPMDVNFKVNVQPQAGPCDKMASVDADARSTKIAQQLQEIEMELKRMQRDLCKAKKDKDTLKAQQATLNCTKNYLT